MIIAEREKNNFDFLRLFAAICITFDHSFNHTPASFPEPLAFISSGKIGFSYVGLGIFFSISGYLIAKSASGSNSFKQFLWKRLLRIQPLLIVVCILSVFLLGPFFTTLSIKEYFLNTTTWTYFRTTFPITGIQYNLPGVFANYAGEKGVNGSLWTLVVEERLYVILGMIFFLPKLSKPIWYLLTAGANIYFYFLLTFPQSNFIHFNYITTFYTVLFLNGATIFLLQLNLQQKHFNYIIVAAILFVFSFINTNFKFLQITMLPLLVLSIAHLKGHLNKTGRFGDFSYGIYVFSFPVQQMLSAASFFNDNPYRQFLVTLIIVFPLAICSWHLVEKRFLKYKNYIIK
jgi:peptidoglycan/LPS O-acetylase OafA/YrhL